MEVCLFTLTLSFDITVCLHPYSKYYIIQHALDELFAVAENNEGEITLTLICLLQSLFVSNAFLKHQIMLFKYLIRITIMK